MNKFDTIVIGGGAAGMMAAGQAANQGAAVLLLEKKKTIGRKLSITGKGRCNLTNKAPLREFIERFGKNGRFLNQAFNRFFSDDLSRFFNDLGVEIKSERGGRIFPANDDALSVVKALEQWVKSLGVKILNNHSVDKLLISSNGIEGVLIGNQKFYANQVIIATGGLSYPATGSTGDGYKLAAKGGHTIVPTRPALVPLITTGTIAQRLMGVSLKNVNLRVLTNNKKTDEAFGEMLFTHYGLSGPIILSMSRNIVDALAQNKTVYISIDLKPALDDKKLDNRLLREIAGNGKKQFQSILKSLLPSKLIPVCCELTSIPPDKQGHHLTADDRKKLRLWLKDFRFKIKGHLAYEEAIVTAGGVSLKEIYPKTMESKIVKGLYFAGEVLDLDGQTGGYNLQAAFSTGYLAGCQANRK